MSEPNRNVTVNGVDVTDDGITTIVELRESGVPSVTFTANNENGKSYLGTLKVGDEIVVRMIKDSSPPEEIDWDTDPLVKIVFQGPIQELSPVLSKENEICSVVAFMKGFHIKEMKVSKEYGLITPVPSWAYPLHFDEAYKTEGWVIYNTVFGSGVPYIATYSAYNNIYDFPVAIGDMIGSWNFNLSPEFDGGEFETIKLHVVAAKFNFGSGESDTITLTPQYTIDDGATWHNFTNGGMVVTLSIDLVEGVIPNWCPYGIGTNAGPFGKNYNPAINDLPPKPVGATADLELDILPDFTYWDSRMKIRLVITDSSDGESPLGGLAVALMYLQFQFKPSSGKTVRQLLAGDEGTKGIIPYYANHILGDLTKLSGHSEINTDYIVYEDPTDPLSLIPYMKFPYSDVFTCMQDIIKYGSALRFLRGECGYHWKLRYDGKLMLAPVTNHDVKGNQGDYITNWWNLFPYATSLKVKEDMISQSFKTEKPIANYVIVAGRFQYPLNDNICRGDGIDQWQVAGGYGVFGVRGVQRLDYEEGSNGPCLQLNPVWDAGINVLNIYAFPFPEGFDITKLMGKRIVPKFNFFFKFGGGTTEYELRLYCDDGTGHPDKYNFFACSLSNLAAQDNWGFVELDAPNTKFMKDYGNWEIKTDTDFMPHPPAIDWSHMSKVKYWAIAYKANATIGEPYVRVRGFSITGVVIRAAYDSTSIYGDEARGLPAYGCRMITTKDSMASTDTLSPDDDYSPLALEAIYDLQRYSPVRTSGEIQIPLDPEYEEGQLVWIQAEENYSSGVPLGTYKIDRWFRALRVTHSFNGTDEGANTRLFLVDDLVSSLPVDTTDVYSVLIRAINPDFQTKTMGSLKSNADLDLGLEPIEKDYPS